MKVMKNNNISKKISENSETLNLLYETIKSENQSFSFLMCIEAENCKH